MALEISRAPVAPPAVPRDEPKSDGERVTRNLLRSENKTGPQRKVSQNFSLTADGRRAVPRAHPDGAFHLVSAGQTIAVDLADELGVPAEDEPATDEPATAPDDDAPTDENKDGTIDALESAKVADLRAQAEKAGIEGADTMKKADLIEALKAQSAKP